MPELKGRSLEELNYMFEARIATRDFAKFDSAGMLEDKRREHHTTLEEVKKEEVEMIEG